MNIFLLITVMIIVIHMIILRETRELATHVGFYYTYYLHYMYDSLNNYYNIKIALIILIICV